jgi:DNA-binding IclR family transcriptional regulator
VVSGVRHAGEILELFTREAPEWGAARAARELGISKSHAHRLLCSLGALGLLERQPGSGRYRVGLRSLALSSVLVETDPLLVAALPILRALEHRPGLEAALAVSDREGVLWLQPSADRLLARRDLADCLAAGTVLLAGRTEAEITARAALAAPAHDLRGRVEHVLAGGLIGDFRGEACDLAAPIIDTPGSVLAALSVRAPRIRWQVHKREFTCALRAAALRLTSSVAGTRPAYGDAPS